MNIKIEAIWATADKLSSNKSHNYLSDRISTVAIKCIIPLLTHDKHRVAAGTAYKYFIEEKEVCVLRIAKTYY